jgi:hypothetical protein
MKVKVPRPPHREKFHQLLIVYYLTNFGGEIYCVPLKEHYSIRKIRTREENQQHCSLGYAQFPDHQQHSLQVQDETNKANIVLYLLGAQFPASRIGTKRNQQKE